VKTVTGDGVTEIESSAHSVRTGIVLHVGTTGPPEIADTATVKPHAVIFDIDGTLLDSVDLHAEAWVEAFGYYGHMVSVEKLRPLIGKGGDQIMPAFVPADVLKKIGPELERYRSDLFKQKYLPQVKPFSKVRELFLKIKEQNQRIALASSGKKDEIEEYKRIAHIADLVEVETTADDVKHSKPAPDIFEAILASLYPLPPERMIVVGDTPYDAEAAAKVGLKTIGLLCGGTPVEALQTTGCILAIFDDPADLLAHYDESPLAR
jgi:HAD superfamily hydrolase (TIGR01509 family)